MSRFKKAVVACIPNVKLTTPVPFGGKIRFLARTHKGLLVRRLMDYPSERGIFRYYERTVGPADVIFDVGANIGWHAVPLALRSKRGTVVAFEPDTDNLRLLRENLAFNGVAGRVLVEPRAASNATGTVTFFRDTFSSATGTIAPQQGNSFTHQYTGLPPETVQIEAITVDDFVAAHPTLLPDLVKIDVEGAETQVLDGMHETVRRCRPNIIIDGTPADAVRRLLDWGYSVTAVLTDEPVTNVDQGAPTTVFATMKDLALT